MNTSLISTNERRNTGDNDTPAQRQPQAIGTALRNPQRDDNQSVCG